MHLYAMSSSDTGAYMPFIHNTLPLYQPREMVRAVQIDMFTVSQDGKSGEIMGVMPNDEFVTILVNEWYVKRIAQIEHAAKDNNISNFSIVGGYYIEHSDGRCDWISSDAFMRRYMMVDTRYKTIADIVNSEANHKDKSHL